MKLLFVLPEYGADVRGGIATYYRHLIPGLRRAGCSIDVCVAHARPTGALAEQDGVAVRWIDSAATDRAAAHWPHLAAVPALRSAIAAAFAAWESCAGGKGYDIVEVTDWGSLYVPWLCAADGPPVLVQLHGSSGQVDFHDPLEGAELAGVTTRLIEAALLGRADELQSGGVANAAEWGRLLERPVQHVWPAWSRSAAAFIATAGQAQAETFGLVAGRIQSWKGPEVLCRALARLGGSAPTIRWIGRDHPFRRLDQSFSDHLRRSYPDVWGHTLVSAGEMSPAETAALQHAASFTIVPSLWDTFNLSVAEAMGAGKVVICAEAAGAVGLIEHGHNGFRFGAGDDAALAALIAKVSALAPAERARIGARARDTVLRELDVDAIAAKRIERFERLKAAPRAQRAPHPWLDNLFATSAAPEPYAFLKDIPLRVLSSHAAERLLGRLRRTRT